MNLLLNLLLIAVLGAALYWLFDFITYWSDDNTWRVSPWQRFRNDVDDVIACIVVFVVSLFTLAPFTVCVLGPVRAGQWLYALAKRQGRTVTTWACLAALWLTMVGCAALRDPGSTVIKGIRSAASVGTVLILDEKPEWKPHFESARNELGALLNTGALSFDQLKSIMARVPANELKGKEVTIIIGQLEFLLGDYLRENTQIDREVAVRNIGQAIYEGLEQALR